MGKVVRTIATIGIAIGAIALAAPTGGLSLALGHIGITGAFATAIISTGAALAGTFLLNRFLPPPAAKGGFAPGPLPGTRSELRSMALSAPPREFPDPDCLQMTAVRPSWWRDTEFWPWQRATIMRAKGRCMVPEIPEDAFIMVSRSAPIVAGDLFVFATDDLPDYAARAGLPAMGGLVKRFLGIDLDRGEVVFECISPPQRLSTPLQRVRWAYRINGHAGSWWTAWRLLRRR